jgi:hypothetical protein
MDLLSEAVQARRARVAGIALQVKLACKSWDRIGRWYVHKSDECGDKR